ncbi:nucleoside diphosphate kinase-like isoform X2 [Haematobia irritans]
MVKPDGAQRGLVGKIIERFEQKGFKLVAMKFMLELLEQDYADLSARPFFPGLVSYMSSGPVVHMVWEGLNVFKTGRQMLGATNEQQFKANWLSAAKKVDKVAVQNLMAGVKREARQFGFGKAKA